jgi:hypothetical protein
VLLALAVTRNFNPKRFIKASSTLHQKNVEIVGMIDTLLAG